MTRALVDAMAEAPAEAICTPLAAQCTSANVTDASNQRLPVLGDDETAVSALTNVPQSIFENNVHLAPRERVCNRVRFAPGWFVIEFFVWVQRVGYEVAAEVSPSPAGIEKARAYLIHWAQTHLDFIMIKMVDDDIRGKLVELQLEERLWKMVYPDAGVGAAEWAMKLGVDFRSHPALLGVVNWSRTDDGDELLVAQVWASEDASDAFPLFALNFKVGSSTPPSLRINTHRSDDASVAIEKLPKEGYWMFMEPVHVMTEFRRS